MTALLEGRDLERQFSVARGIFGRRRTVRAVDGVSLAVGVGEAVAVVGESGAGKSTLARICARLDGPTAGRLLYEGQDVTRVSGAELLPFRRGVQLVFQDPGAALDPRMTVQASLREPFTVHGLEPREEALLADVNLGAQVLARRPHELSGGEKQRVVLARALALEPRLLVLDEPFAALDVSVAGQVLALLRRLRAERGLALLFVTHDLRLVRGLADRVAVMLRGRLVEEAPADQLFSAPQHEHTRALLAAEPRLPVAIGADTD